VVDLRNISKRLSRFLEIFPGMGNFPKMPKWATTFDRDGNLVVYNWMEII